LWCCVLLRTFWLSLSSIELFIIVATTFTNQFF